MPKKKKKNKRARGKKLIITSMEQFHIKKERFNAFIGTGVHGKTKYSRKKKHKGESDE